LITERKRRGNRGKSTYPEVVAVKSIAISLLVLALVASPCIAEQKDTFYLKAEAGYSIPLLSALTDELDEQGLGEQLPDGGSVSITLGRSFFERSWTVELSASLSLYRAFKYENEYEDFTGKLSNYAFTGAVTKRFPIRDGKIVPLIGMGLSYGQTNLVEGGGKLKSAETHVLLDVEWKVAENVGLLTGMTWRAGVTDDTFESPYLENVTGDVIFTSDGKPLEDRFQAFDFRVGVIIWLPERKPY
jgi:hypothetical protein